MLTLLISVLVGVAGVALGAWLAKPQAASRDAALTPLPERLDLPSGPSGDPDSGPRRDPTREFLRAFRHDHYPDQRSARERDQRELSQALDLAVDQLGARSAMLGRLDGDGKLEVLVTSLGESGDLDERQTELATWAANERKTLFDGPEQAPHFAAAGANEHDYPVVVTVWFAAGRNATRESIGRWLPRQAIALARQYEVVRTRAEVARSNYRLNAIVRAAMTLQGSRDAAALEPLLLKQARALVGATWGALVRWEEERGVGDIRALSEGDTTTVPSGAVVPITSIVGEVCVERAQRVLGYARAALSDDSALMGDIGTPAGTQSLLIVPILRSREERSIGALVCGHHQRDQFTPFDARMAANLGIVAAGPLTTAWHLENVAELARQDPLTGLRNRRAFAERFEDEVRRTDRKGGGEAFALILADIDHFKQVNDSFGHGVGDKVLREVAAALAKDRRDVDTVARIGGEELAILLPDTTLEGAREVAERVRLKIESLGWLAETGEVRVTASFGIAMYTARAGDSDRVFARADKALYTAKDSGRNRVEVAP